MRLHTRFAGKMCRYAAQMPHRTGAEFVQNPANQLRLPFQTNRNTYITMPIISKRIGAVCILTALTGACSVNVTPTPSGYARTTQVVPSYTPAENYRLAPSHWTDVAKIRAEAQRLGMQVNGGRLSKVQAAQHLNRFRLGLVGSNPVDDSVYEIYLRSAVDSQRGAIDPAQSKALVESALRGWAQRWHAMSPRPNNPAFTNFLMEHMGMPPLK